MLEAFFAFENDTPGYIDTKNLKDALERVGEKVTEDETFRMISIADPENSGRLQFSDFKSLVLQKREDERGSSEEDLLDAFVAMGGQPDGEGSIDADKLISTIKKEFEMTIDIEKLIAEVDSDTSGLIEFDEFKELLQSAGVGGPNSDDD